MCAFLHQSAAAVCAGGGCLYRQTRHPTGDDIDLVVEVSKTSLQKDKTNKLSAYAEAGIQEYWIVDVSNKEIQVNRDPQGNDYLSREVKRVGDQISPIVAPTIVVKVDDLFA